MFLTSLILIAAYPVLFLTNWCVQPTYQEDWARSISQKFGMHVEKEAFTSQSMLVNGQTAFALGAYFESVCRGARYPIVGFGKTRGMVVLLLVLCFFLCLPAIVLAHIVQNSL